LRPHEPGVLQQLHAFRDQVLERQVFHWSGIPGARRTVVGQELARDAAEFEDPGAQGVLGPERLGHHLGRELREGEGLKLLYLGADLRTRAARAGAAVNLRDPRAC
jgi:hypothetical protein